MSQLTRGQTLSLETLVQLVQAYETSRHAIDTSDLSGIDMLKHLVEADERIRSGAPARRSCAHGIEGERSLTVEHVKKLAAHFRVRPDLFLA